MAKSRNWHRSWFGVPIAWLLLISALAAQDEASDSGADASTEKPARPHLHLDLRSAVRLATINNSDLKVAYYDHLIERTRIVEQEAVFEPVFFVGSSAGTNEVAFPQIFPTGNTNPDGSPEFFQTIVTDSSFFANWNGGVRGLVPTGGTFELRTNTDFVDRDSGGLINPSFRSTTSATFTQPILRNAWLQYNYAGVRQARYAESQSRQRYRLTVLNTIFSVHQAYWNYYFAIKDLEVKQRSLSLAERLLEINRVKVDTGVFARIEIAAARSGVANRVTDVLVAENLVQNTADDLRRLIMPFNDLEEWDTEITITDLPRDTQLVVPALQECLEIAFTERPDLIEARIALRSRALGVAVADNETLPKVDLTGSVSFTGLQDTFGDSFIDSYNQNSAESYSIGLTVEIPLGNKAARARLARSRLERDSAIHNYRNLKLIIVEAVREAYRRVDTSLKTVSSTKIAADLKQEELKNEQIKLENKSSTNFQVLQVQEDLALRESEEIQAVVTYRIALAELAAAVGSTIQSLKWPLR